MAIRLMTGNPKRLITKTKDIAQQFNYLLLLDFEATCEKEIAINKPEIIEFPCLAINTNNWKIESSFHKYIKPKINPILSSFCTDLTGIMQETIDDESHFPVVFHEFCNWLEANKFIYQQSAFVTCGDWDLKVMLPAQCQYDNLTIPNYLNKWINLKKSYYDATKYYPKSLKDMLMRLRLEHQGRSHSGLCDTLNMARVIKQLGQEHDAQFQLTSKN